MARVLFIGIVLAIIAFVWRARESARGRAWTRLLLIGFAALVIVTILFPRATTIAAEFIGIGRGADLVFYMTSFAVMLLAALVFLKVRSLEDRIASLVRDRALEEWDLQVAASPQPAETPAPDDQVGRSQG